MPSFWSDVPPSTTDQQEHTSVLLAGGCDGPLHQVAAQQQKTSSKSLQLSTSPPGLQQHEILLTPTQQVSSAHLQQPSPAKHPIKAAGLPAMHPAHRSIVMVGSQPGVPQSCLRSNPTAGLGKVSRTLSVAEKRSPLKGSNAWPPASPSPKKGTYRRSQNRAPVRGNGNSVPAFIQEPSTDPMALHYRLR